MARLHYSMSNEDVIRLVFERYGVKISEDQIARAYGNEFRMSWKKAVEVGRFIKYMTIKQAEAWLEDVADLKKPVPIRRFTKKQAHHSTPWAGWPVAKWPVKVASNYLSVLKNLENNARFKGLDVDRVVIVHVASHKGITIRNYMPRAFGRSTPWNEQTVNIEIIGVELPKEVVPKRLKLSVFK
ncbi:MAG: 50S ribosomal protein L22 [Thermoproteus sp.]